ncbi:hypothetical protein DFH28DRAFT_1121870 [Melampsora americana]|nr:hypothetical protein DFH28DRAFT_1121870 [Melampsora americana]
MQLTIAIVVALAAACALPNGYASSDYAPSSYTATSDYAPSGQSGSQAQPEHIGSKSSEDASKPEGSRGSLLGLNLDVGNLGLGSKHADIQNHDGPSKGGSQPTISVVDPANSDHGKSQPVTNIPQVASGSPSGNDAIKLEDGGDVPDDVPQTKSTDGPIQPNKSIVDSISKPKIAAPVGNEGSKLGNEVTKPAVGGIVPVNVSGPKSTNGAVQPSKSIVDSTSKGQPVSQPGSGMSKSGNEAVKPTVTGEVPVDVTGTKSTSGATQPIKPVVEGSSKENVGTQPGNGGFNPGNGAIKPTAGGNIPVNTNVPKAANGGVKPTGNGVESTSKGNGGSVENVVPKPDQTVLPNQSGQESGKPAVDSTSDGKVSPKTGHPKPSVAHGEHKHRYPASKPQQGETRPGHAASPLLDLNLNVGSKAGSEHEGDKSTSASGSHSDSTHETSSASHGYTKSDYA